MSNDPSNQLDALLDLCYAHEIYKNTSDQKRDIFHNLTNVDDCKVIKSFKRASKLTSIEISPTTLKNIQSEEWRVMYLKTEKWIQQIYIMIQRLIKLDRLFNNS